MMSKSNSTVELLSKSVVGAKRSAKFGTLAAPIFLSYALFSRKMRLLLAKNPNFPEEEQDRMWAKQHARAGVKIAYLLQKVGGLYIKSGQDLAARGYLLPQEWMPPLQKFWNKLPPRPYSEIKRSLQKSLRKSGIPSKLNEIFSQLDEQPLASASIGQVHTAVLREGEEKVVVKVIYSDIQQNLHADMHMMKISFKQVEKEFMKAGKKINLMSICNELVDNFPFELDFELERDNLVLIENNLKRAGFEDRIKCPAVFDRFTSQSVIVLERMDGETFASLQHTIHQDPARLAQAQTAFSSLVDALGHMIFQDHVYHADPHPGNIMLMKDGRLGLLDFGQVKRLTDEDVLLLSLLVLLVKSKSKMAMQFGMKAMGLKSSTESFEENFILMSVIFDTIGSGTLAELGGNLNTFHKDKELAKELGSRLDLDVSTAIRMQAQWMKNPMDAPVFTELPRAVIFMARIITLLRKDCEVLHREVSVVSAWAPRARMALQSLKSSGHDSPMLDLALALPESPHQTEKLEALLSNAQRNPHILARFIDASDRLQHKTMTANKTTASTPIGGPHSQAPQGARSLRDTAMVHHPDSQGLKLGSTATSRTGETEEAISDPSTSGMKDVVVSLLDMLLSLVELSGESMGRQILEQVHEWLDEQNAEDIDSVANQGATILKSNPNSLQNLGLALKELKELEPPETFYDSNESDSSPFDDFEDDRDTSRSLLALQKEGNKEVMLRSLRLVSAVADIIDPDQSTSGKVHIQLRQLEHALLETPEERIQFIIHLLIFVLNALSLFSRLLRLLKQNPAVTFGCLAVGTTAVTVGFLTV